MISSMADRLAESEPSLMVGLTYRGPRMPSSSLASTTTTGCSQPVSLWSDVIGRHRRLRRLQRRWCLCQSSTTPSDRPCRCPTHRSDAEPVVVRHASLGFPSSSVLVRGQTVGVPRRRVYLHRIHRRLRSRVQSRRARPTVRPIFPSEVGFIRGGARILTMMVLLQP